MRPTLNVTESPSIRAWKTPRNNASAKRAQEALELEERKEKKHENLFPALGERVDEDHKDGRVLDRLIG